MHLCPRSHGEPWERDTIYQAWKEGIALINKYRRTTNLSEKFVILRALSAKSNKAQTLFFLKVYQKSKITAIKRYALNGVARADGISGVLQKSEEASVLRQKGSDIFQILFPDILRLYSFNMA